jgi:hypothetical protein
LLCQSVWVLPSVQFIRKWREAAETDVKNHTQRPDVHSLGITSPTGLLQDLWRNICID